MSRTRLEQTFAQALEIAADTDFARLEYRGIPQWDSVAHMNLVAEIESTFDVMLDADEVIDMSSFTKATEILTGHGVEFEPT